MDKNEIQEQPTNVRFEYITQFICDKYPNSEQYEILSAGVEDLLIFTFAGQKVLYYIDVTNIPNEPQFPQKLEVGDEISTIITAQNQIFVVCNKKLIQIIKKLDKLQIQNTIADNIQKLYYKQTFEILFNKDQHLFLGLVVTNTNELQLLTQIGVSEKNIEITKISHQNQFELDANLFFSNNSKKDLVISHCQDGKITQYNIHNNSLEVLSNFDNENIFKKAIIVKELSQQLIATVHIDNDTNIQIIDLQTKNFQQKKLEARDGQDEQMLLSAHYIPAVNNFTCERELQHLVINDIELKVIDFLFEKGKLSFFYKDNLLLKCQEYQTSFQPTSPIIADMDGVVENAGEESVLDRFGICGYFASNFTKPVIRPKFGFKSLKINENEQQEFIKKGSDAVLEKSLDKRQYLQLMLCKDYKANVIFLYFAQTMFTLRLDVPCELDYSSYTALCPEKVFSNDRMCTLDDIEKQKLLEQNSVEDRKATSNEKELLQQQDALVQKQIQLQRQKLELIQQEIDNEEEKLNQEIMKYQVSNLQLQQSNKQIKLIKIEKKQMLSLINQDIDDLKTKQSLEQPVGVLLLNQQSVMQNSCNILKTGKFDKLVVNITCGMIPAIYEAGRIKHLQPKCSYSVLNFGVEFEKYSNDIYSLLK